MVDPAQITKEHAFLVIYDHKGHSGLKENTLESLFLDCHVALCHEGSNSVTGVLIGNRIQANNVAKELATTYDHPVFVVKLDFKYGQMYVGETTVISKEL